MYTLALRHPTLGTTPTTSTRLGIVETRWCSTNSTPTIPSGSPKQEMTGQQPEGRLSTGRSAVRNSLCKPRFNYPTPLPGRQGQPSSPDITLLSGNLLPDVAWSTLGSDHHAPPSPRKARSFRTSARLDGRELQQRQRGIQHLPLGQMPPPRPDDRGDHPVPGAQQNACGHPPPLQIDPAEQLLARSYRSALSQLRSGHCSRLQSYSHSVGLDDDPTCPITAPPTTQWPISLAVPLIPLIWPRRICGRHPFRSLNSWQDYHSSAVRGGQFLADWFWVLFFITFIPAVGRLLPGQQRDHIFILPFTPLHLTRDPGVISPSAN